MPRLIALLLALPAALGARVAAPMEGVQHVMTEGAPRLEVLATDIVTAAAAFLERWKDQRDFGMFLRRHRAEHRGGGPVGVG